MLVRTLCVLLVGAVAGCGQDAPPPASQAPAASPPPAAPVAQSPAAGLPRTPAPAGAAAYIIAPEQGATVSNPVRVVFGLKGFGVVPAGIERPDAGHHHLLIDTDLPPLTLPIPNDEQHRHFGAGQTEVDLTLPAGEHRLQLLLGDHLHIPHDPPIASEVVTITVQ